MILLTDTRIYIQSEYKEVRIGNTIYIVKEYFASSGVTVSEKIRRLLDRETRQKTC